MQQYTIEERVLIVKTIYQRESSITETLREKPGLSEGNKVASSAVKLVIFVFFIYIAYDGKLMLNQFSTSAYDRVMDKNKKNLFQILSPLTQKNRFFGNYRFIKNSENNIAIVVPIVLKYDQFFQLQDF